MAENMHYTGMSASSYFCNYDLQGKPNSKTDRKSGKLPDISGGTNKKREQMNVLFLLFNIPFLFQNHCLAATLPVLLPSCLMTLILFPC